MRCPLKRPCGGAQVTYFFESVLDDSINKMAAWLSGGLQRLVNRYNVTQHLDTIYRVLDKATPACAAGSFHCPS